MKIDIGNPYTVKTFDIKLFYCIICIYLIGAAMNKSTKTLERFANIL